MDGQQRSLGGLDQPVSVTGGYSMPAIREWLQGVDRDQSSVLPG